MNSQFFNFASAAKSVALSAFNVIKGVTAPMALLILGTGAVLAFTDLNAPQALVYDTSHLADTQAGSVISYSYTATDTADNRAVEDRVLLNVVNAPDEVRRDVSVEFLSGDLKIALPDFDNYRGNPVVIVMLEHLAQSLGKETDGGALYFRNRIRDALADESLEVVRGADSPVQEFSIQPLLTDPFVAGRPRLKESVITLTFNDELPGLLQSMVYISGPADSPEFTKTLEFAGVEAK